jgi:L-fuculose-phosphate aldolase
MEKEKQLRNEIVRIGQKLYAKGLLAGTDGNISCRLNDNTILITPSGRPKGELDPDEMVILNLDGKVTGNGKPSSEYKMHLLLYRRLPDITAVVHAHPPITTAYSVAGQDFPIDILPEGIIILHKMAWVDYGAPSTDELPDQIDKHLPGADIFVLKNHGVTTVGKSLEEAYLKLETCEHQAKIALYSRLMGGAKRLGPEEIDKLLKLFDLKI